MRSLRRARRRGDRGAAAVEFALVVPILLMLVFGIIDYGIYFNNSLSARQGVREAARSGVVETAAGGSCASESGFLAQLACTTKSRIGPVTGTAYVRTFYTTWAQGQTLTVCSMVQTTGLIRFVPYPNQGFVRSRIDMAIETPTPVPAAPTTYQDALPIGQSWSSWC